MNVVIDTGYSRDFSTRRYANVIVGLSASNIGNERTVFQVTNGVIAALDSSLSGAPSAWDLRVLNYAVDMALPQQILLDGNAFALRSQVARYDCNNFGNANFCLSGSVRYQSFGDHEAVLQGRSDFAVALTAAKRINRHWRMGLFIEFGAGPDDQTGIDVISAQPMFGVFLGYDQRTDGLGLQAKISLGYKQDKARFIRASVLGESTNASGDGDLGTFGVEGTIGYGFDLNRSLAVTPYAKFTYSRAVRGAYQEDRQQTATVQGNLNFSKFANKQVSGTIGVRFHGAISPSVKFHLGGALEHDFSYESDVFHIDGSFGASSYTSVIKPRENRVSGSGGLSFAVTPSGSLSLDGFVSDYAYGDRPEYTVMVSYRAGF